MSLPEQRAQRLLRCYPPPWLDRYGDELAALLVDDLAERPRCLRRDLDVIRAGLAARLVACGLTRGPVRDRSAAAAVSAAASVCFAACAVSIWTQLADGRLTAPAGVGASVSLVTLTGWLAGLLALSAMCGLRLAVAAVRSVRAGEGGVLLRPLLTFGAAAAVLAVGVRLIAENSPGAQAARRGGVLAHAAGIGWAATQTISTFWLHPHRLLALPASDVAWMVICPAAVAAAGWSLVRLGRVLGRSAPRRPVPIALFLPCLAGAAAWVVGSQHAANVHYRAGTLDLVLIAVMAAACWAAHRARGGDPVPFTWP